MLSYSSALCLLRGRNELAAFISSEGAHFEDLLALHPVRSFLKDGIVSRPFRGVG